MIILDKIGLEMKLYIIGGKMGICLERTCRLEVDEDGVEDSLIIRGKGERPKKITS